LGAFIAGALLAFVNFPQNASPTTLDPAIAHNLALVYLPTVVVLFTLSILCLTFYRIRREDHDENIRKLAGELANFEATEPVVLPKASRALRAEGAAAEAGE
jgi:Na+/melibiose symporter-like transporter